MQAAKDISLKQLLVKKGLRKNADPFNPYPMKTVRKLGIFLLFSLKKFLVS